MTVFAAMGAVFFAGPGANRMMLGDNPSALLILGMAAEPLDAFASVCRRVRPVSAHSVAGAIGAVVARFVHTEEVTGSNPVSPTSISPGQRRFTAIRARPACDVRAITKHASGVSFGSGEMSQNQHSRSRFGFAALFIGKPTSLTPPDGEKRAHRSLRCALSPAPLMTTAGPARVAPRREHTFRG